MSSMIQWCDGPRPRVNRPCATSCVDSDCCSNATGWRDCSGTTAVPISMRDVTCAISAAAVMASNSSGTWGIQTVLNPCSSAQTASLIIRSTLVA